MDPKREKESLKVVNQSMLNFESDEMIKEKAKSSQSLRSRIQSESNNIKIIEKKTGSGDVVSLLDQSKASISLEESLTVQRIRSGLSVMDFEKGEQSSGYSPGNHRISPGFSGLDLKFVSQSTANFNYQRCSDSSSKKVSSVVSFSPTNQYQIADILSLKNINFDEFELPESFLIPIEISLQD